MGWLQRRGFRFSETMAGSYERDGRERPFSFDIDVVADSAARYLKDSRAEIRGVVTAEGFASATPLVGVITIRPFRGRLIRYEFDFDGDDGQPYRFVGEKSIGFTRPAFGFRDLPGKIVDGSGTVVATCITKFDLRGDLFKFIASWRPYAFGTP